MTTASNTGDPASQSQESGTSPADVRGEAQQEARKEAQQEAGGTVLEGIRGKVFLDRYARKGEDGTPLEQYPEQMWRRVAAGIAAVEPTPEKQAEWTERFYGLLRDFKFVPGGRILSGTGTGHQVTYYNCYVVGLGEDPLDPDAPRYPRLDPPAARPAFFTALGQMTDIMSRSGGVGINLSALPPRGTPIAAPGRAANAGATVRPTVALSLAHPDVARLLDEKDGPNLSHVDVAVIVPREFDQALRNDEDWTPRWNERSGETVRARDLWARLTSDEGRKVGILRPDAEALRIDDSRDAIVSGAAEVAERLYQGQATVVDFSLLRPRGAYIKTVNGTSSGPVAWMYLVDAVARLDDGSSPSEKGVIWFGEIASTITGKTIQQGGSRRGALMLMLDDDHPDVEEFIAAKRIGPDGRPVMIEHANMSLCVSDRFMEAVKADLPWDLVWQGRVVRTIRARDMWDRICTAAWTTAEPGVVFMERYQDRSNTYYFENIRCVNPCVTGDTQVLTDKGPRAIAALAQLLEQGETVHVISPTENGADAHRVEAVFSTGVKPVFLLQTVEGHSVRLTADHRVLTDQGWVEARDLTPEHRIHSFDAVHGSGFLQLASFTADGEEMVYDLTEPQAHLFVGNGIICHNCGEQGLPPGGVCNLGALNLERYVDGEGRLLEDDLARDAAYATRFLDDVIDATPYFSELHVQMQREGTRRTGLGTMGLADALIRMEVGYGSPASLETIDRIYRIVRDASYRESVELAREKGPFGRFDREEYLQGWFIGRLPADIQEGIREHGIRNGVLLTQAPTGTTSLLAGVSSGIEPVFDFAMKRVDRTGEHIMYHPLYQQWRDQHPGEERPAFFVGAKDLTPEEHIVVQAKVQEYTDSSISKTANVPNDFTVDNIKDLYMQAYDLGCKGVTCYRDGSRDAVLTSVTERPKETAPAPAPASAQTADDGAAGPATLPDLATVEAMLPVVETDIAAPLATPVPAVAPATSASAPARTPVAPVASATPVTTAAQASSAAMERGVATSGGIAAPGMPTWVLDGRLKRRPNEMPGFTQNVTAPEGKVNITINSDADGPLELFINVGRAGTDIAALAEALGRLISLQLRLPSTMSQEERLRQVANQLRGIGGSRSIGFGKHRVLSLPDAVAQAIYRHLEEHPAPPPAHQPVVPVAQLALLDTDDTPYSGSDAGAGYASSGSESGGVSPTLVAIPATMGGADPLIGVTATPIASPAAAVAPAMVAGGDLAAQATAAGGLGVATGNVAGLTKGNGGGNGNGHGVKAVEPAQTLVATATLTGNLCPQCGSSGAYVFEEGCKKCHYCGYSEC